MKMTASSSPHLTRKYGPSQEATKSEESGWLMIIEPAGNVIRLPIQRQCLLTPFWLIAILRSGYLSTVYNSVMP